MQKNSVNIYYPILILFNPNEEEERVKTPQEIEKEQLFKGKLEKEQLKNKDLEKIKSLV